MGPYQTIRRDQWRNRLAGSRGLHSCHGSVLIIRVNGLIPLHTQMVKDALGRLAAAALELVGQRYLMERDVALIVDAGAR